ncbi:MAG: hypothetical protein F4164_08265 [Gemmatimonadales bacterium]|nr:hypothetical protein [Gemmatimonadales bacterium]
MNAVTEDVFTAGSVVGDRWDTFGRVASVQFDARSNLHIFDSQADHILVVGPDGSLIRTVGGEGDGPGELGDATRPIVARDGSYTVIGSSRIDFFGPDGGYVRRITLDPMTTGIVIATMALPDGRLVTSRILRFDQDDDPEEGGWPIHLFPLDGSAPELLYTAWKLPEDDDEPRVSGSAESMRMTMAAGRALEPRLDYDVLTDGRLALIDSIGYRVKLIAPDGSVTGTIGRPIAPLPVDEEIMEAERERYREQRADFLARMRGALDAGRFSMQVEREGAEGLTFAEEVPVLWSLKVDWEDRIWLGRRDPTGAGGGPIDIVTPGGDYIGTLAPEGLRTPSAFGPDGLMAYIESDELDVQTVRVVRLVALEPEG